MNFGVMLTKKNFDYLRPNQLEQIKAKEREKSAEAAAAHKKTRVKTAVQAITKQAKPKPDEKPS